jgi:hypothetical protein
VAASLAAAPLPALAVLGGEAMDVEPPQLSPAVEQFVRVRAPSVVLAHVQVIDGTGSAPLADRNVVIEHGKIAGIMPGSDLPPADGRIVLDLHGYTTRRSCCRR